MASPPLPPGFQLDAAPANPADGSAPSPPPGFQLDAAAGAPTPQQAPAAAPQQQPSLLGSTMSTLNHAVTDIPVVGPALQWAGDNLAAQTVGRLSGQDPAEWLKHAQAARAATDAANPIAAAAGGLGGNVAAFALAGGAPAAADALGMAGGLGKQMLNTGLSTLGTGTVDNMIKGQSPADAMTNAAGPAALASGVPVVGRMVQGALEGTANGVADAAQRRASSAAVANAPSAADLKAQSSAMFKAADQSGVTVDTPKFSQFVQGLVTQAKRDRINPTLDPKATAAYQELIGALNDVQQNGASLSISDIHTLRQIAQRAATSTEGRDAMFASRIVKGLDGFITQSGALKLPGNRVGNGMSANDAANAMLGAIATWGRSRRVDLVNEAIYKAGTMASGTENGLRLQFQQLLRDPDKRKLFTDAEQTAIRDVANGTMSTNALRFLGRFGFSKNNWLGSTLGNIGIAGAGTALTGNPLIGAAAGGVANAIGTGARMAAERAGSAAAQRAANIVATPNIRQIARPALPDLSRVAIPAMRGWLAQRQNQ
jgi:hypothetical protein